MPIYIEEILRTPTQYLSYIYGKDFVYPHAISLLYIWEGFCVPHAPIYMGRILRGDTLNWI